MERGGYSRDAVAKMNIPALWLFGEKDRSMPVELSISSIETIIRIMKMWISPIKYFQMQIIVFTMSQLNRDLIILRLGY